VHNNNTLSAIVNKISGYAVLGVVLLLSITLVKNILRNVDINKKIATEKAKVEQMKQENANLAQKVAEIQSQAYIEEQLRDKLGLAKEGEIVVVLPDTATLEKLAPEVPTQEVALPDPNWKKWLKLFI
jgi:cell division protein DivIC